MKIFKWVSLAVIIIGLAYSLFGCTYGTYNAAGSYPDQTNNRCEKVTK